MLDLVTNLCPIPYMNWENPIVTWFICFTCDYLSITCCHWLYEVSLCGNGGGGRYDDDDSILPITCMSLGELTSLFFYLHL